MSWLPPSLPIALSTELLLAVAGLALLAAVASAFAMRRLRAEIRRLTRRVESGERLALVAEHTDHLVMIIDRRHHLLWANAAFTRHTGFELHDAIGRDPDELLSTESAGPVDNARRRSALEAGSGVRTRLRHRSRDGREVWVDADLQPLPGASGATGGCVTIQAVVAGAGAAVDGPPQAAAQAQATPAEDARSPTAADAALRRAVADGDLDLAYQGIVDLDGDHLIGVQAIPLEPGETAADGATGDLLALAERLGLGEPVGDLLLRRACEQFAAWQRRWGSQAPPLLLVQLAPSQLRQPGLVAEVRAALDAQGLRPEQLQLQLHAHDVADDRVALAALTALRAAGVRLAVAGFGSGQASLASLHQLPVESVRIDRTFVAGAAEVEHHQVLISATIRLARTLGMNTLAEGVGTAAEAELMRALGCDRGQGGLFGEPLSAQAFELAIERQARDTVA